MIESLRWATVKIVCLIHKMLMLIASLSNEGICETQLNPRCSLIRSVYINKIMEFKPAEYVGLSQCRLSPKLEASSLMR